MNLTKLLMTDYKVEMMNDGMQDFFVQFHKPKHSPYQEGVWKIRVELPDAYPYKSPSIGFVNYIYHLSVDAMEFKEGEMIRSIEIQQQHILEVESQKSMANGSFLDCLKAETFSEFHGNSGCLVEDRFDSADHVKDKQKSLFSQIFGVYLKENCRKGNVRPVPVMLGDGQLLDLYQLFSLVKEKGGYDAISRKGLWDSVIDELGLDLRILASVKLVYEKYLSDFEGWLRKTFEEKSCKNGSHGYLNSFLIDLEEEFQSLLCSNLKDKDDDFVPLESNNIIKHIDFVNHKSDGYLLDPNYQNNKCKAVHNVNSDGNADDDEKFGTGVKNDLTTSCAGTSEKEFYSRKRKRESLSGMVNWTRNIAKHLFDPLAQPLPEISKWKDYKGSQDFFFQMLRARDVLSVRKHAEPNSGSSSKKVKMHPAMYEDPVSLGHQGTVNLRRSERLPICVKLHGPVKMKSEKCPLEKTTGKPDVVIKKKKSEPSMDDFREKVVSVGNFFQAEVPEWTGVVSESDSKWLGTQVWPVKDDSNFTTETDLVGRGRRGKCNCNVQGSVDCVRFHIADNRMKLKVELRSVFYHWGFDKMGEEVSLRWTADEEKRFKDAMGLKIPSQNKSYWNNPSRCFRRKARKDLVRYYFNVYLIQLRSYQNRVTPNAVDSDDDEVEFGSFDDGFGRKAIRHPSMEFMECTENKQCFDFE